MKKQDIMINVENPTHFSISLKVGGTSDFIVLAPDSIRLMSEYEYLEHKETLMTFGCKITPMEVRVADTSEAADRVAEKAASEKAAVAAVVVDESAVAKHTKSPSRTKSSTPTSRNSRTKAKRTAK